MNSLWDIRIFLGLVPKESPCIRLPCGWHWPRIACETIAPRFVSCPRRTWCQESSPEMTVRFMSASVANELPGASEWLQGDEKSLDHILTNWMCDWSWHYGWEVMYRYPNSPDLKPSHVHLFGTSRKHFVAKWYVVGSKSLAWHTKAAPNGKCCEGYIVPSMVRLMYQLKSVLK